MIVGQVLNRNLTINDSSTLEESKKKHYEEELFMEQSIELLKRCLETRSPVLLLGAGFSLSAKAKNGENLMLGGELCKKLYEHVILPNSALLPENVMKEAELYCDIKKLKNLCELIRENNLVEKRNDFFLECFSGCTYGDAEPYSYLADYDWQFIFSLNIDDLVEEIYRRQKKPLTCWKLTSDRYKEVFGQTVLVKLHGDVGDPDTYVFDDDEYRKFSDNDNWMMRKFSDLYVCRDLIVVGSQFQERDVEKALQTVFKYGCDDSDYHFFFISPGPLKTPISDAIKTKPNFHHISWSTNQFLEFLKSDISEPKDALQRLCCQGVSFWNQQIIDAQSQREDWELYHGRPSEPKDFHYSVDIIHTEEQRDVEDFFSQNRYGYIEIKGKPYVGKTCFAKRILSLGVKHMFKAFYCVKTDIQILSAVEQYLGTLKNDDSILICFENSSGLYRPLVDMIEKQQEKLQRLIVIVTSNDTTRESDSYVFNSAPLLICRISEKIDYELSNSIYSKLYEKTQLGKLLNFADKRSAILKYIRDINDFIDVLYVAHHGTRFASYFNNWLSSKADNPQLPVFQAITLLTSMGVPPMLISRLPDISYALGNNHFNYQRFNEDFGEFCFENSGMLYLRCSRLFKDVVLESLPLPRKRQFIYKLSYMVSKGLYEGDRTYNNELFKHLTRAASLKSIAGLSESDALDVLIRLKESCKHLSYYWIQMGIIYRNLNQFEEAQNAFEYAENAHGRENYQIAHAKAKNYMEWGLWALHEEPTQSSFLFEEGATKMLELLWQWKYPDAICFSTHAFIDMNLKYHTQISRPPENSRWSAMKTCMEKFVNNSHNDDNMVKDLFKKMVNFAHENKLPFEEEKELRRVLRFDSNMHTADESIPDIDVLPVYDY